MNPSFTDQELEQFQQNAQARKRRRETSRKKRIRRKQIRIGVICVVLAVVVGILFQSLRSDTDTEPHPPSTDLLTSQPPESTTSTPETVPENTNRSLLDFLKIASQPVGSTMYVWGGGWNEEDTGSGIESVTLGISPRWAEFAALQSASYDYHDTEYQIHDGLDCSGYVGWAVYNVLETENGKDGYVLGATKMAKNYAERGFGTYIPTSELSQWLPGDIMSMDGHVWIVVGMCDDGSVLFLHASPPGVIFCGTNLPDGSKSQAVQLAEEIMRTHYPSWYAKYPNCSRSYTYLTRSWAMRWSRDVLSDEEGLCSMSAEEIVDWIYS